MKKFVGAKELADKWGVSERRIRLMCQDGRIEGAVKLGWSWSIPSDTPKPFDGRHMRQYKTGSVRLGSIDVTRINRLMRDNEISDKLFTNVRTDDYIAGLILLGFRLDGRQMSRADVLSVFSQNPARSLSYADVMRIAAFRSLFLRAQVLLPDYNVRSVLSLHGSFCQGWDDRDGSSFRAGDAPDSSIPVSLQMETFFMQYDREWKGVHPVFKAVLLLCEFIKDRPFETDSGFFALLVSCVMLLAQGILPPALDQDDLDELNATLALAVRKSNYEDLARLYERCILKAYSDVFQVS